MFFCFLFLDVPLKLPYWRVFKSRGMVFICYVLWCLWHFPMLLSYVFCFLWHLVRLFVKAPAVFSMGSSVISCGFYVIPYCVCAISYISIISPHAFYGGPDGFSHNAMASIFLCCLYGVYYSVRGNPYGLSCYFLCFLWHVLWFTYYLLWFLWCPL